MNGVRRKIAVLLSSLLCGSGCLSPVRAAADASGYAGFPDLDIDDGNPDDDPDSSNTGLMSGGDLLSLIKNLPWWIDVLVGTSTLFGLYAVYHTSYGKYADLSLLGKVLGKWPKELAKALIANGVNLENGDEDQLAKLGEELYNTGQIMTLKSLQLYWKLTVECKNKLKYDSSFWAFVKRLINPFVTQYSASANTLDRDFNLRYKNGDNLVTETQVKPFNYGENDKKIEKVVDRGLFSFVDCRDFWNNSANKYQHLFSVESAVYLTYKFIYNINNLETCTKVYGGKQENLTNYFTFMSSDADSSCSADVPCCFAFDVWKDAKSVFKKADTWVWKCGDYIVVRLPQSAESHINSTTEKCRSTPASGPLANRVTKACEGTAFEEIVRYAGGITGWLEKMNGEASYKTLGKDMGVILGGGDLSALQKALIDRDKRRPALFYFKYK